MSGYTPNEEASWLTQRGPEDDVVVSSRIRYARNLAGHRFVNRSDSRERRALLDTMRDAVHGAGLAERLEWLELDALTELDRRLLVERHLISEQHMRAAWPRAVAISSPDERLSIMVNEEDHIRLQVIHSGFDLSSAFEQIDEADDRIESHVDYAFSSRFGYLTACPTNVGTGIRVSVMVHLPALKLTGEIEKVRRSAKAMSLAVRGFYGEGSEAAGDVYQLSNQTTLGRSEQEVLERFERLIIPKIIDYERTARRSLLEKRRVFVEDQVYRALGVLNNARLLKADEAMQLLSHVRLGVGGGILKGMAMCDLNALMLQTQTAHLQRAVGRPLDQAERRIERATLVRDRLRVVGG